MPFYFWGSSLFRQLSCLCWLQTVNVIAEDSFSALASTKSIELLIESNKKAEWYNNLSLSIEGINGGFWRLYHRKLMTKHGTLVIWICLSCIVTDCPERIPASSTVGHHSRYLYTFRPEAQFLFSAVALWMNLSHLGCVYPQQITNLKCCSSINQSVNVVWQMVSQVQLFS